MYRMPLANRSPSNTIRPLASSPAVRKRMASTKKRDTPEELRLRRVLHGVGLRYLVDAAPLPGLRRRADVMFRRERVAVFVDGCFWHSCPRHGTQPKSNAVWWCAKLAANVRRDRDTDRRLRLAGWLVIRVWAHEDPVKAAGRIFDSIARRRCERCDEQILRP